MVGPWKAKVYDMHNVVASIKSRRVPGAMTDDELFNSSNENEAESEELDDILTEEEKRQLEIALKLDSSDLSNENGNGIIAHRHSCYEQRDIPIESINSCRNGENRQEKKGWFNNWRKRENKQEGDIKIAPPRSSLYSEEKVSDFLEDSPSRSQNKPGRHSVEVVMKRDELRKGKDSKASSNSHYKLKSFYRCSTFWQTKLKLVRRLRELLTSKLPKGTFPVKVAIPVVPTIKVLVTFTKFEELQPLDEFSTPPSSPTAAGRESPAVMNPSSSSWFRWIKSPYQHPSFSTGGSTR
ncbi:Ankyrin repeat family protein [Forsythia ovata]|uniref:Ankyrin repeat family protein n=1 Tax=Forsythia ovata TaxID=205694 RepID=A0ABD1T3K5_9LAMI